MNEKQIQALDAAFARWPKVQWVYVNPDGLVQLKRRTGYELVSRQRWQAAKAAKTTKANRAKTEATASTIQ